MRMSATENGEPMAEALVEQPGGAAADGVTETEEQRLQEVERQRVEKEKRDEIIRKQSEEMEESTRRMRAERRPTGDGWRRPGPEKLRGVPTSLPRDRPAEPRTQERQRKTYRGSGMQ